MNDQNNSINESPYAATFELKRSFFDQGYTKSYAFRIEQLKKLKSAIQKNEALVVEALYKDLHKPEFEAFTAEIGVLYEELNVAMKSLKKWMKPEKVRTPLVLHPSSSTIYHDPLGVVLIIGPWNYPFQLLLAPLIGAIAAGNCAIIKPSDQTPNVSNVVKKIIEETFEESYISVVQGPGASVGPMLIEPFKFDHIFFTGSASVGKQVAKMAAQHLTPVTLELGGKSPVIVSQDANLEVSAKRLVWAKFYNAGQTCVCPDYLLVHESVKDVFIEKMKVYILEFFGNEPIKSDNFGRIVNHKRVDALKKFLSEGRILHGGDVVESQKFIAPTLMDQVSMEDLILQEEIFGPILPILTFKTKEEALNIIRQNRYPLALYLYTESKAFEEYFIENVEFGGGCINNGMMHLVNAKLPFGGVGQSGMGQYHGKYSFETFSHKKSVLKTATWLDPNLRYAPYNARNLKLAKLFMK